MIKKTIIIIMLINIIFFFMSQELMQDNEFYKKGVELLNKAKEEFDKGEYDKGYEYSEQAKENFKKSNEANNLKLLKLKADENKKNAEENIKKANEAGAEKNEQTLPYYNKAVDLFKQADEEYKKAETEEGKSYEEKYASYQKSIDLFVESSNHSKQAIDILSQDKDSQYAKDLLDKGYTKRDYIINNNYIVKDGTDDAKIMSLLNDSKTDIDNKNYKNSIEKSENALSLIQDIINKNSDKNQLAALKEEADKLLKKAKNDLTEAENSVDLIKYKDKLNEADSTLKDAENFYNKEMYNESIEKSKLVIKIISEFEMDKDIFPKFYKVRLIPKKRDCFWRIAAYHFIYNNPWKWKIIYEANKDKLKAPNNPHLLYEDTLLEIPSLSGEKREGTFDPEKEYPKYKP